MRGKFIVFEGIDGAGKSTHLQFVCDQIHSQKGVPVLLTREPGGTPLAEKVRNLVLHEAMDPETQVLLVTAARKDHVQNLIKPALEQGHWVVCDRFTDSTRAYQGGGGGLNLQWIDELSEAATSGLIPDRIYLFDLAPELAAQRRGGRGSASDRFEEQGVEYFSRVRQVYLQRAHGLPELFCVVDAQETVSQIQSLLKKDISRL